MKAQAHSSRHAGLEPASSRRREGRTSWRPTAPILPSNRVAEAVLVAMVLFNLRCQLLPGLFDCTGNGGGNNGDAAVTRDTGTSGAALAGHGAASPAGVVQGIGD